LERKNNASGWNAFSFQDSCDVFSFIRPLKCQGAHCKYLLSRCRYFIQAPGCSVKTFFVFQREPKIRLKISRGRKRGQVLPFTSRLQSHEAEKGVRFYRLPRDSSRTRTAPCSTTNAPKGSSEEAGPPNILCDHSVVSQAPRAADSAARQNAPACARCFKFSAAGLRPPPPSKARCRDRLKMAV